MATSAETLNLRPDELAFVFDSEVGVKAADLADFLKKAATVSRRAAGAELYVVGLREGSLAVVVRVLRKAGKASWEELKSSPVRTTGAAIGIAGVAMALTAAMKPTETSATPLARAAAVLVEDRSITQISLISIDRSVVVMDNHRAQEVRSVERKARGRVVAAPEVRLMIEHAATSGIRGTFVDVDGELHFRPQRFRYLVPVAFASEDDMDTLAVGRETVVWGELLLKDSQPDILIVREIGGN